MNLYSFLRPIVIFSLRIFFRKITVYGLENIPDKGPVIFVSNHPNTLIDPLMVASRLPTQTHFLANASIFTNGLMKFLLRKMNTIPVYRQEDRKNGYNGDNQAIFRDCFTLLNQDGRILIFPEGTSIYERRLRTIKTGTARMALGALQANGFQKDIAIVCVGLFYSSPEHFRSEVLVNFSKPLSTLAYKELFDENPDYAYQILTGDIRHGILSEVVHLQVPEYDHFMEGLLEIQSNESIEHKNLSEREKFEEKQEIINNIQDWAAEHPDETLELKIKWEQYQYDLQKLKLKDEYIASSTGLKNLKNKQLKMGFFLSMSIPFFLIGLIINYIPFLLPGTLAKKLTPYREYRSSIKLMSGLFIFTTYYILTGFLVLYLTKLWWAVPLYLFVAMTSGLFAFRYSEIFTQWKELKRIFLNLYTNRSRISMIKKQRSFLINQLKTILS